MFGGRRRTCNGFIFSGVGRQCKKKTKAQFKKADVKVLLFETVRIR